MLNQRKANERDRIKRFRINRATRKHVRSTLRVERFFTGKLEHDSQEYENPAMQHDKIKPILFSVIKHSSKEELKKQLPKDIVSGIVVAVVALPLSIALAIASGVGPEAGLYTAIVAGFLIAFLGGSRVQISGPTAAFATIVAGIVATDGLDGLFAATIIAGVVLILMGVFKLGALIRFVPYTITTGFTAGIAVTIVIGQIKDLLGLTYPAGTPTVETTDKIQAIVQNIATVNTESVLVGLACLVVLFLWPKFGEQEDPQLSHCHIRRHRHGEPVGHECKHHWRSLHHQ